MRSPLIALTLCLVVVNGLVARVFAAEPPPGTATLWMTDFPAAQAEAKKLNRPLLVHFYGNSCPPCRQMEKEFLNSPAVLKMIDGGFIAVKVCLDKESNARHSQRLQVENMPTDLILSPEGKSLWRHEGYVDKATYVARLTKIDSQYAAEGKRLARSDAKTDAGSKATADSGSRPGPSVSPAREKGTGDKRVPDPIEPRLLGDVAEARPAKEEPKPVPPAAGLPETLIAMEGYCPVTLRTTRTWKPGDNKFAFEHEGVVYHFVSAERRNEFKANPRRYAPKLMGCDPVVLAERHLAITGNAKFGAYYEGELFLFESADTRTKFKKDPTRYTRLQHVLKPQDVQRVASTSRN